MSRINSTPTRLDMQDWRYPSLNSAYLRQSNNQPDELSFYSVAGGPGGPLLDIHADVLTIRIRGSGFGDFDANGVPHSGTVTGASLFSGTFEVFFSELNMPVPAFLAMMDSNDPARMRAGLTGGNDLIEGGAQSGAAAGDILIGGAGDDTIYSFGGHDTLSGGPGDDLFRTQYDFFLSTEPPSAAVIEGGEGFDVLAYDKAAGAVTIDAGLGVAGGDTFTGIESLVGSPFGDSMAGGGAGDILLGRNGDDTIDGRAGNDSIEGNVGNDLIFGGAGSNYLRGVEGDDSMVGGGDFDDMNGNTGADTLRGGEGFDWVVGGQGDDMLYGDVGGDVVYGNLGSDTCVGGDGVDWVRGGQANDSLDGGAGNDLLWGDRGDDTVTGGLGADTFHAFVGGGLDRITDFNAAQGDRLILDFAPPYTLRQEGADTVVDLGGVDRVVLVDVTLASLPAGWIAVG
ncbi:MAG: calcium-binding protein [Pseudomonadota bacterium]